jgi:hypothetical protein
MNVSARFYASALTYCRDRGSRIELQPVTRGEHNKPWSSATPSGKLHLYSLEPDERDWFAQQIAERPNDAYGCEFDAVLGTGEPSKHFRIVRHLRLSGVTQHQSVGEGRVHLHNADGPWTELELLITNRAAFQPLWEHFVSGDGLLWFGLV